LPTFPHREMDQAVFEQRKPYTSGAILGPTNKRWVITLAHPVFDDAGEVIYSIQLIVPAEYLGRVLAENELARGWVLTLRDGNGTIIADSVAHENVVGQPISAQENEATRQVARGQNGNWRGVRDRGGRVLRGGFYRMISTGWLVSAAAVPGAYERAINETILVGIAAAGFVVLVSLFLSMRLARRFIRAIAVLKAEATALGQGKLPDPRPTFSQEVNEVAAVMRQATLEIHRRDSQQQLLLQELNHRVKNTLTTVQSLARRTFRTRGADAYPVFESRLLSLSKTHNLLTTTEWKGANILDIMGSELGPYGEKTELAGPDVFLPTRVALSLSMVIHELGTNAAKHGAYVTSAGRVVLSWAIADGMLQLEWTEAGGPPVRAPQAQGFGTTLIHTIVVRELQGRVDADFAEAGLRCWISVPLAESPVYRNAA